MAEKRSMTAKEAAEKLKPFGFKVGNDKDGKPIKPSWAAIDTFVKNNPKAKDVIKANKGALVQSERLGFSNGGAVEPSEEAIKKLADLQFLSYKTGVSTAEMTKALNDVGIDSTYNIHSTSGYPDSYFTDRGVDTSNWEVIGTNPHTGKPILKNPNYNLNALNNLLSNNGYTNSGNPLEFYGDNKAEDPIADAFDNKQKDLFSKGQEVINSSAANALFAEQVMADKGITADQTSYTTVAERGMTLDEFKKNYQDGIQIAQKAWANSGYTEADGAKDILGYTYEVDTTKDTTPTPTPTSTLPTTIPIEPTQQEVEQAQKVFSPDGKVKLPTGYQQPMQNVSQQFQPVSSAEGVTNVQAQTFGQNVANQGQQFAQRAMDQAQLIQPQTLAEKTAAGTAPTIQQRLYRNQQGMTTYVTGTVSPDGKFSPTTPVPQGYTQVQQMQKGGSTVTTGGKTYTQEEMAQEQANLTAGAIVNPAGTTSAAPVANINPDASGTVLSATTGQAAGVAPIVTSPAQVSQVATADTPTPAQTATATNQTAQEGVQTALNQTQAAQSTGPTQTIQAATQDPTSTQVGSVDAAQIGQAQTVQGAPTRQLQTGEMISGSTVDQTKVGQAFGTGEVQAATVKDELSTLMQDFEEGDTPAWAAGAMRNALAGMASRGLGASSLAGQAAIQAAMESALPIAMADASNKQQMAMLKAEQRAKFLNMEFDQNFQTKVMNAAKVSEVANMNFNAQQQVALENARMAQTVDLANLNNRQALVMAEAAQISQLETQNLSNIQQARVQNAQNFLQIDMSNLSNQQQTEIFKAQTLANTILSDTASANAFEQFNASSQMQVDQFNNTMKAQISQFNSAQTNAMNQFNAGETNAIQKFNSELQNQREIFNSQMYAQIAQANAKWRQDTTTINTAAANQSNFQFAKDVNGLTNKSIDQIWQRERDLMSFAMTSSENAMDRAMQLLLGDKELEGLRIELDAKEKAAAEAGKASLFSRFLFGSGFTGGFGGILSKI